ncbi:MAG: rRNA maturation RNase YbeY, partial [Rhodospirillales bacterium]
RAEVSVLLSDDDTVRRLNRDHRGQDRATDVLSFPDEGGRRAVPPPADRPLVLGDIVVAYQTVAAEAAAEGKSLADHLSHLVVHGMLHLLGHDHRIDAEAAAMERLEAGILATLGVADPYAVEDRRPS